MDWSPFVEEFKKNKLQLLIVCVTIFVVVFVLSLCSGGSSQVSRSSVRDNLQNSDPVKKKSPKINLFVDLSDKRGLQKMDAFFVRRTGRNLYKIGKRSYKLTEDELYGRASAKSNFITNTTDTNKLKNPLLDKPQKKVETEMIFRRPDRKKLQKKKY